MKTLTAISLAAWTLATSFASMPARAQSLADPTRPPASLGVRADTSGGGAGHGQPRLQSVLIAPRAGGRHVAVIDGETVRLGGNYKGARVARMTQNEVELVRGRQRQVLRLHPTPALPQLPAAGGAAGLPAKLQANSQANSMATSMAN